MYNYKEWLKQDDYKGWLKKEDKKIDSIKKDDYKDWLWKPNKEEREDNYIITDVDTEELIEVEHKDLIDCDSIEIVDNMNDTTWLAKSTSELSISINDQKYNDGISRIWNELNSKPASYWLKK